MVNSLLIGVGGCCRLSGMSFSWLAVSGRFQLPQVIAEQHGLIAVDARLEQYRWKYFRHVLPAVWFHSAPVLFGHEFAEGTLLVAPVIPTTTNPIQTFLNSGHSPLPLASRAGNICVDG